MKRVLAVALCTLTLSIASGCYTMHHTVGAGAQGSTEVSKRQWFALWGLVPITDTDSQELAAGATDYSVETQWSFVDILINILTSFVTVYSRTMTVTK